jgi:hypothetical protein
MATRREEKERLRQSRLAHQQAAARQGRRKVFGAYGLIGLVCLALIAGLVALVAGGNGGSSSASADAAPFGQHYKGLGDRMGAAQVPTMMKTMGSSSHFHPHLAVYVNGKQVEVPADIGIDPSRPSMQMAGLHTHDTSGTIHDEGMASSRLGQFFSVWGVPLSAQRLGPHRASGSEVVRMWVDGKPSRAFGALNLADGQQIVVSFGSKTAPPPPLGANGA